jgi:hypothetical protein
MPGVRFIDHKGHKILLEDYSEGDPDMLLKLLDEAQALIAKQPPASVRALVNAKNGRFDRRVSERMKQFVKANTPYIKASAVIGMSGLQAVIYKAIVKFTGRKNLYVFDSEEKAREFLVNLP